MREILFRGKNKLTGAWCEGHLVKTGDHYRISTRDDLISFGVDVETVGQYTGLTDKNGKKVFEGDIVTRYFDELGLIEYEVEFDEGEFLLTPCEYRTDTWAIRISGESENIEVIDNIYGIPELHGGDGNV